MFDNFDNGDENSGTDEVIKLITEKVMQSCAMAAVVYGSDEGSATEFAHRVICNILMFIMKMNDNDSVMLTIQPEEHIKQSEDDSNQTYRTHIHYDYLDADPDHLRKDFGGL